MSEKTYWTAIFNFLKKPEVDFFTPIFLTSVPRRLRCAPAPGNAFVLSVETCDSSRCVIREGMNERERERERERSLYQMSQTILRHNSKDGGVSRRRSGAEVHGNNSRKIMKKKETLLFHI